MNHELPLADELAAVFARMSGLLLSTETVASALALVTALAAEAIPASDGAGVTLLDGRGNRVTAAATDPVVSEADGLQYEFDEGPCLMAWARRTVVRVDDIGDDDRWPRWAHAVMGTGLRSALSAPLVAGSEVLGAIKVYSRRPGTYDDRDGYLLTMFAAQAAVLLANVRSYEDAKRVSDELKDSLRARDLINMAKGVLMAREAVDEEAAFMLLTGMAREQGEQLSHVAGAVTRSNVRRRR
jgi:GAF domain-containing protein